MTGEAIPRDETPASLARMMIGRELPVCEAPPYSGPSRLVLEIRQLSQRSDDPFGTSLTDVSLTVNGEIVGIAGISGNGQAELLAALSGEAPSGKTTVWLDGEAIGYLHPGRRRARAGLCAGRAPGRGAVPRIAGA